MKDLNSSKDLLTQIVTKDILNRSGSQPIYISAVEVVGGQSFSDVFFKNLLSPVVDSNECTFKQLVDRLGFCHEKLMKIGVFKDANVSLHSDYTVDSSKISSTLSSEKLIPTKIIFDLKTINLNTGDAFLNINNEDNLNLKLNYLNNNFNENAEVVNIGVNYNPYKPNEHLIANAKFLANLKNPSFKFLADIFNTHQNNHQWLSCAERTSGGVMGLQYVKDNLSVFSGLSITRRAVHDIDDAASDEVKFYGGDFLKSSFVNQICYSNLKFLNGATRNFPTNGLNLSISNEISSNQEQENVQNQHAFTKTSVSMNFFKSFFGDTITTEMFKNFGFIHTGNDSIHISDRFYLGGQNNLKGFNKNSINEVGGLQFYFAGTTIYSRLPKFFFDHKAFLNNKNEPNPLRVYATGMVGNVAENIFELNSGAASAGIGLKYVNNWAKFDLGYYYSTRIGTNDNSAGLSDKFQFSVSIGGSNRF